MKIVERYISLIQKLNPNRERRAVEWVSFHIPKTGGVSFRNYLVHVYGNSLLFIYSAPLQVRINNKLPIWVPSSKKVLHGHFQPHLGLKEQFPNAKWVIWFREPKSRIISHYNYWKSNPQNGPAFQYFNEKIHSFKDFVLDKRLKGQVCLYQTYLNNVSIQDFDFIGILENADQDLVKFSQRLGKDQISLEHTNKSAKIDHEDYQFTEEMMSVIKGEMDIYKEALKLNAQM